MKKHKISNTRLYFTVFTALFLVLIGLMLSQNQVAYASSAAPVTIHEVDYEEEEIVINNNNNTKIFFATEKDAAKGNWDVMLADKNADDTLADTSRIDFSWVSASSENAIVIMGGDDSQGVQRRVVLKKRTTKLEISINYSTINSLAKSETIASLINIMSTAGTGEEPIDYKALEWKKGEGGKWKDIDDLTVAQLEKYQIKGTDLYFRIMAVNDITDDTDSSNIIYPNGSKGSRASSETRLKVAKKATSTAVSIDGKKFTADIKYGKEYRVTINGERTKKWIKVLDRSVKRVSLVDIVKQLGDSSNGLTDPFPAMTLEIRSYATEKAAASKITEVILNAQRVLRNNQVIEGEAPVPAVLGDSNIYIYYNGDKNMVVTIPSASSTNPYEYSIVKPGDSLDIERASWSSITKSTAVKILSNRAVEDGILYIRQKEIKYKKATKTAPAIGYQLASTYVSHLIKYPAVPEIDDLDYTYVKGLTNPEITFDVRLNKIGGAPFETKIKNIKLGTKEILFDQVLTPSISDPIDITKAYIITVTLDSGTLAAMGNTYGRALTITFENGTINKTSVKLTIKNPSEALLLTATPEQGTVKGTTKVKITGTLGTGNIYGYYFSDTEVLKVYEEGFAGLPPYTVYNSDDNITTGAGYIIMMEINPTAKTIVKYKCIAITSADIMP